MGRILTISTLNSQITVAATGASSYVFNFIGVSASDISVLYTTTTGIITTVPSSAYTVTINAPLTGIIWGVGGSINPVTPANFSSGSLTVIRTLPLTQTAEISNQGNQYPIVTETALDTLCMEIQQIAARTGSYRGVWVTGATYNFGDIVQDGVNGAYTNNIYVAAEGNTSGVWATDLAAGDWVLAISVATLQPPGSFLPLSGGTVSGNLTVTGTATTGAINASGTITGSLTGNVTGNVTGNISGSTVNATTGIQLNGSPVIDKINIQNFPSSNTYTPSSGMQYCVVDIVAAGGSGGNGNSGGGSGGSSGTYARVIFTAAQVGSPQTVTIGAAGSPTTFGALISCPSGSNGTQGSSGSGGVGGANSPSAASITSGGTILNIPGQAGGSGANPGAGSVFYGGIGGSNPIGFGGALLIYGSNSNGIAGSGYGSGGGGATGSGTGASGKSGIVIITEYISV